MVTFVSVGIPMIQSALSAVCKTHLSLHGPFNLYVESYVRVKRVQRLMQGGKWLMFLQFFIKEALTSVLSFSQMVHLVDIIKVCETFFFQNLYFTNKPSAKSILNFR